MSKQLFPSGRAVECPATCIAGSDALTCAGWLLAGKSFVDIYPSSVHGIYHFAQAILLISMKTSSFFGIFQEGQRVGIVIGAALNRLVSSPEKATDSNVSDTHRQMTTRFHQSSLALERFFETPPERSRHKRPFVARKQTGRQTLQKVAAPLQCCLSRRA